MIDKSPFLGTPYEIKDDLWSGFSEALKNNQQYLALHYIAALIDGFESKVNDLEKEVEKLKSKKQPAKKTTSAKNSDAE